MEFYNKPGDYDAINYIPHSESHGTKELWKTFWLLLGITLFDFMIYFVMPTSGYRNFIFIFLDWSRLTLLWVLSCTLSMRK